MSSEATVPREPASGEPDLPTTDKTPLYEAFHALRYQRQQLIRAIDLATKTTLITCVCGSQAYLSREDSAAFVDLLHGIEPGTAIDLLLHTPGGDIEAAEKTVTMIRQRVGSAKFRVIVPDFAKSSGTLIALGADEIVMSDSSELGPIDPQVSRVDGNGNRVYISVHDYLEAYARLRGEVRATPADRAAEAMLDKMDPAIARHYEAILERARAIAEAHLHAGMHRDSGAWTRAASKLVDATLWPSHGQTISWQDASTGLELAVDYREPADNAWQQYWRLYCLQYLEVKDNTKLFESSFVSLPVAK